MSNGLAYGFGGGGLGRLDKEIDFKTLKQKSVFKKATYTDPFKRLSLSKKGSKLRSNSVDTPPEQPNSAATTTTPTSPSTKTKTTEPIADPNPMPEPTSSIYPTTQISYHSLDATSPNPQLSAILSLSKTIFSSTTSPETKYSSLSTWQSHLTPPTSIIFFATTPSPSPTADVDPIAFIFAFPRSLSEYSPPLPTSSTATKTAAAEDGVDEVLHIWLTGVLPAFRGHGIFAELMDLVEIHAREKGFRKMSVATVPGRFGDMFRILQKGGWVEVERVRGEGWEEGEGGQEGKVIFMKTIDEDEKAGVEE